MLQTCVIALAIFSRNFFYSDPQLDVPTLQTWQAPLELPKPKIPIEAETTQWAIRNEAFEIEEIIEPGHQARRPNQSKSFSRNNSASTPMAPYGSRKLGNIPQSPQRFAYFGGGRHNQVPHSMRPQAPKPPAKNRYHGKQTNRHKPKN